MLSSTAPLVSRPDVSDLSYKLGAAVIHKERLLQHAQESMLDAAKVLVTECSNVQRTCDEARAQTRKNRMNLESLTGRNQSLQREVSDLEARVRQLEQELQKSAATNEGPETSTAAQSGGSSEMSSALQRASAMLQRAERRVNQDSAQGISSSGSQSNDISYTDFIFLNNRLQLEVDAEEVAVTTLRRQYQDQFTKWKLLCTEADRLKQEVQKMDVTKRRLQEEQLVLAAANANHAHRDALNVHQTFSSLQSLATEREEELRQTRIETSTLIAHLLSGAHQRAETVNALRKALLVHGRSGNGTEVLEPTNAHFADALLKENVKRRADLSAVLLSCDREKDALRQFIHVLSQRVDDATHRHYLASKRSTSSLLASSSQAI